MSGDSQFFANLASCVSAIIRREGRFLGALFPDVQSSVAYCCTSTSASMISPHCLLSDFRSAF